MLENGVRNKASISGIMTTQEDRYGRPEIDPDLAGMFGNRGQPFDIDTYHSGALIGDGDFSILETMEGGRQWCRKYGILILD